MKLLIDKECPYHEEAVKVFLEFVQANEDTASFIEDLGLDSEEGAWYGILDHYGGISMVESKTSPGEGWRQWKKDPRFWLPDGRTKAGKKVKEQLAQVPSVSVWKFFNLFGLTRMMRIERSLVIQPGFIHLNKNGEHLFGLSLDDKWGIPAPEGTKELTTSQFREIFGDSI